MGDYLRNFFKKPNKLDILSDAGFLFACFLCYEMR